MAGPPAGQDEAGRGPEQPLRRPRRTRSRASAGGSSVRAAGTRPGAAGPVAAVAPSHSPGRAPVHTVSQNSHRLRPGRPGSGAL